MRLHPCYQALERCMQGKRIARRYDEACLAHDPGRIPDIGDDAGYPTSHRLSDRIRTSFARSGSGHRDREGIVNARHVCAWASPPDPLGNAQLYGEAGQFLGIGCRPCPNANYMYILPFGAQACRRLEKRGVVFSGDEPPDEANDDGLRGNAPFGADSRPGFWIGRKTFDIDSTGNDGHLPNGEAPCRTVGIAGIRIDDDYICMSGEGICHAAE